MKKVLQTAVFTLLLFSTTFASGFQLNEHGAKAMSMANAFTAYANDASAVYFNPAAISYSKGTKIMLGISPILPSNSFEGPTPLTTKTDAESKVFFPFNAYFTHKINDQWGFGFAVNVPFGLGTEWDETWPGRYLAQETDLKTFFFQPVISYKFSEKFAIGVGINYSFADVTIARMTPRAIPGTTVVLSDSRTLLEGDDTAIGFTASLMIKPSDKVSIGATYRSEVEYEFEGEATSTPGSIDFTHPLLGNVSLPLPNGEATAPLTLPQNLQVGIAVKANEKLTVTADFQYVGWSSYDKLEISFKEYRTPSLPGQPQNPLLVSSAVRDFEDNFAIRGGFEYKSSEKLAIRGGVYYDKNPIKDELVEPQLPDNDRIGLSGGVGLKLSENVSLDLAYLFLLMGDREVTNSEFGFNGTYSTSIHLFAFNFQFGL